jgi:hypothetical protein
MKPSSTSPRRPLNRATAWGCLTSNLAIPGSGTIVAGRRTGYLQGALALAGMGLTTVYGVRFITWYFANRERLQQDGTDPFGVAGEIWVAVRWALLGMALFAVGWLWALGSSLAALREARRAESASPSPKPPLIRSGA